MRLCAVTLSVSYSDYLVSTLRNRSQFDDFVVVTVPDDAETISLCGQEGLRCCIVQDTRAGGIGFHAAYNKSRFINSGLRHLREQASKESYSGTDDWAVVLDADVLLPTDFRERLEAMASQLDQRKLYGLCGRRVAGTGDEFQGLATAEPWDIYLETHQTVIGYFNLFLLRGVVRSYPPSPTKPYGHDDARFYVKYGPIRSAKLPITALHLGNTAVHWGGRVENVGTAVAVELKDEGVLVRVAGELGEEARAQDTVLVGAWTAEVVRPLAAAFRRVLVADVRGLAVRSRDALEEADRAFLWRRFAEGLAGFSNVFLLRDGKRGRPRAGLPVAEAPEPGSVGLVLAGMEPSYGFLLTELPRWLAALRPGGWVCGTHYGHPAFPQTTPGIELLLGTPRHRDAAGGWAWQAGDGETRGFEGPRKTRKNAKGEAGGEAEVPAFSRPFAAFAGQNGTPIHPLALSEAERLAQAAAEEEGVVLWVYDREEAARALTALHTLRGSWRGPLAVVHWGAETPALRIGCARFGAAYVGVVGEARARKDRRLYGEREDEPVALPRSVAALLSLAYSPFARTLLVTVDGPVPRPARWLAALRARPPLIVAAATGRWSGKSADCAEDADFPGHDLRKSAKSADKIPVNGTGSASEPLPALAFAREYPSFLRWMTELRRSRSALAKMTEAAGLAELRRRARRTLAPERAARALADAAAEDALLAATPAHVWLPEDCTLVTAVTEDDVEPLRRSWRAIRWPAGVRRLVVPFFQKERADEWLPPGAEICPASRTVAAQMPGEPYWNWALVTAAQQARTRRLLYMDPCLSPLPGAQLFHRAEEQQAAYCGNGWAFVRQGKRVLKTPKLGPPAALFDTAWLHAAAQDFMARAGRETFELFLHRHAGKTGRPVVVADVMPCGWNR